jgi:hypothetical protein
MPSSVLLSIGFVAGVLLTAWFLLGNRLQWKMPARERLHDDFTTLDPLWTTICVGNAGVNLLAEEGARGGTFARMIVKSAVTGQLALAQIDDYLYRPFADYPWWPPLCAQMRMRFSNNHGPGTAGFWFWNNGVGLGAELTDVRPFKWLGFYRISPSATLPYSAVQSRFRASVANGSWPGMLSLFGVSWLPAFKAVEQPLDGMKNWTEWHAFTIEWRLDHIRLLVDGECILDCDEKIKGPLALVFWYDNNHPEVRRGSLHLDKEAITAPEWLDIDFLTVEPRRVAQPFAPRGRICERAIDFLKQRFRVMVAASSEA